LFELYHMFEKCFRNTVIIIVYWTGIISSNYDFCFDSRNFFCFGWTILGSNRGRGKSFFLLQNIEAHFRSQTVSYSMSPIVICKQRVWGVVVTANLHLEARLRLSGAISLWKNFTVLPIPFIPNLCVCVCRLYVIEIVKKMHLLVS
jgi:hypothetical protein